MRAVLLRGGLAAIILVGGWHAARMWLESVVGPCGEVRLAAAASPTHHYAAEVLERNCGATTDYVRHVNLRAASTPFTPRRDGTIRAGEVFVQEGPDPVALRWPSPTHLIIRHTSGRVFKQERSWRDVTISYERSSP